MPTTESVMGSGLESTVFSRSDTLSNWNQCSGPLHYRCQTVKKLWIQDLTPASLPPYLSYTATLLTAFPVASIPDAVTVSVLPSAVTTAVCFSVGLPPFLYWASIVVALMRLNTYVSAFGLLPVTGRSAPVAPETSQC